MLAIKGLRDAKQATFCNARLLGYAKNDTNGKFIAAAVDFWTRRLHPRGGGFPSARHLHLSVEQ
jgi:hypothetical protein